MYRLLGTAAAALYLAGCATAPEPQKSFSFLVMGDAPYSEKDNVMLAKAMPIIAEQDYPFIIHVGDYKGGGAACTADHDMRQRALVKQLAPTSVFYTPGDNEWADCDRFEDPDTKQPVSDLERLSKIRSLFFGDLMPTALGAAQQVGMPENARWTYGGVQFATINVAGTNNSRDYVTVDSFSAAKAAASARDTSNLAWLAQTFDEAARLKSSAVIIATHADMTDVKKKPKDIMCTEVSEKRTPCDGFTDLRAAIQGHALKFEGPVLLIHGDTSPFTLTQTFSGEEAPNLYRLNAAGDSGENVETGQKWGTRDVTHVTYTRGSVAPFEASGLLTGKIAKSKD